MINLITQRPSILNMVLFLFSFFIQFKFKFFTIIIVILSYLYIDFNFFIIHLYLDNPKTLNNKINFIKKLATDFQNHHLDPKDILNYNAIFKIDIFVFLVLIPITIILFLNLIKIINLNHNIECLFLSYLFVILFSCISLANHYFCHAITHQDEIKNKTYNLKYLNFCKNIIYYLTINFIKNIIKKQKKK